MKALYTLMIAVFGCCQVLPAVAQGDDEGIFLNPTTGDYIVRFFGFDDAVVKGTFFPHTKINPSIKSRFDTTDGDHIKYQYKVKNGRASKQDIATIIIYVSSAGAHGQVNPTGWVGSVALNTGGTGEIVGWSSRMVRPGMAGRPVDFDMILLGALRTHRGSSYQSIRVALATSLGCILKAVRKIPV